MFARRSDRQGRLPNRSRNLNANPHTSRPIALNTVNFFLKHTPTTEIYTRKDTLSLHDALPIFRAARRHEFAVGRKGHAPYLVRKSMRSEEHTSELQSPFLTSYAVFCLKKKKSEPFLSTMPLSTTLLSPTFLGRRL